jgi:hypothetical protein
MLCCKIMTNTIMTKMSVCEWAKHPSADCARKFGDVIAAKASVIKATNGSPGPSRNYARSRAFKAVVCHQAMALGCKK